MQTSSQTLCKKQRWVIHNHYPPEEILSKLHSVGYELFEDRGSLLHSNCRVIKWLQNGGIFIMSDFRAYKIIQSLK